MARKQAPLVTVSYVTLADGREVVFGSSDESRFPPHPFTPEQRTEIGQRLAVTYLNELERGKAEFYI